MTAALEGGEWSAARPGRTLPPGKTRYPFYRRLGGPQGRSGRAEYTSGIAALNWELVFRNTRVYMILEKYLKREFKFLKEIHILCYGHNFYSVQRATFEKLASLIRS